MYVCIYIYVSVSVSISICLSGGIGSDQIDSNRIIFIYAILSRFWTCCPNAACASEYHLTSRGQGSSVQDRSEPMQCEKFSAFTTNLFDNSVPYFGKT